MTNAHNCLRQFIQNIPRFKLVCHIANPAKPHELLQYFLSDNSGSCKEKHKSVVREIARFLTQRYTINILIVAKNSLPLNMKRVKVKSKIFAFPPPPSRPRALLRQHSQSRTPRAFPPSCVMRAISSVVPLRHPHSLNQKNLPPPPPPSLLLAVQKWTLAIPRLYISCTVITSLDQCFAHGFTLHPGWYIRRIPGYYRISPLVHRYVHRTFVCYLLSCWRYSVWDI